jgi:hypothetical protein
VTADAADAIARVHFRQGTPGHQRRRRPSPHRRQHGRDRPDRRRGRPHLDNTGSEGPEELLHIARGENQREGGLPAPRRTGEGAARGARRFYSKKL